ncbi:hypothetical protein pb186bvf_003600 [Paramecium bursaria]
MDQQQQEEEAPQYQNDETQQMQQQEPQQSYLEVAFKQTNIQVIVSDPIVRDGGMSKFTVYNIKGEDQNGKFDVYRRFSDFVELRELLLKQWPGCYIPPIPEKQIAGGNDQDVVESRKRLLQTFLVVISYLPHIFYSDEFNNIFLRQIDVAKSFVNYKVATTQEIIDKFGTAFPALDVRDQTNSDYMLLITTFQGQLKKSQNFLKSYIEQAQQLSAAKKSLNEQKLILYQVLLPTYERLNQNEYVGGIENQLVLTNSQNQFPAIAEQLRDEFKKNNPLDNLLDLFKFEFKDADAIQGALNVRDQLIQKRAKLETQLREDQYELAKIASGKQTITTITNSVFNKGKDAAQLKVETKIQEGQLEIDRTGKLLNIVTAILAQQEIRFYKKSRIYHFNKIMAMIKEQETQCSEPEFKLFQSIYDACSALLEQ